MSGDWLDGGGTGAALDVEALLDGQAGDGLHALVATGALVSVGLSRDRGALQVTVTVDGRWRREWFRDAEPMTEWLAEAIPAVAAAVEEANASAAREKGSRRRRGL